MKATHIGKLLIFALVILSLLVSAFQTSVLALSDEQKSLYNSGIYYYDIGGQNNCSVVSTSVSISNMYIIGDSYAVGLKSTLTPELKKLGFETIDYNAHTGRSINGGGSDNYPAKQALKDDELAIKNAGAILVVLGTNPEDYNNTIPEFMKNLNSINATAKKYWVNVGVTRSDLQASMKKTNDAIDENSDKFTYKVIDWNSKVKDKPSLIAADKTHPSVEGYKALTTLVSDSIGKVSSQTIALPVANPDKDMGTKNEPYVWAYFIGKGLTPVQTAGIMGNMKAEAHFEPRLVEYGWLKSRGEKSVQNTPSSWDEQVPPDQNDKGQPGYGLVQWTSPGRKQGLRDFSQKSGKKPSDLSLQLDYVWKELNNGYKGTLKDLQASTTYEEATSVILHGYEKPGNIEEAQVLRTKFAKQFLEKYAGFSANIAGCDADVAGQAGEGGWDLKGSHAMVYYAQDDPKWANKPYGNCPGDPTIKSGGCGVVSMAMIVSTLTGTKIEPPEMAKISVDNGFRPCGAGTDHDLAKWVADRYNLKYKELGKNLDGAAEILNKGGLVWVSVGAGTFTSSGHLMVIRKVTADGKFYLADPYSEGGRTNGESNKKAYTKEELMGAGNLTVMFGLWK